MKKQLLIGMLALACAVLTFAQSAKMRIHSQKVYTITDEAARILKDVEEQAYEVTGHAGTLYAAGGLPGYSAQFHLSELEAVKDDVNAMGKEMQRLEALRENEAAWERETVGRAMPLLKQLAAATDEAIRYVNGNPQKLAFPQYREMTRRLYGQSADLWKALHGSVRLEDLQEKEARLKAQMK